MNQIYQHLCQVIKDRSFNDCRIFSYCLKQILKGAAYFDNNRVITDVYSYVLFKKNTMFILSMYGKTYYYIKHTCMYNIFNIIVSNSPIICRLSTIRCLEYFRFNMLAHIHI